LQRPTSLRRANARPRWLVAVFQLERPRRETGARWIGAAPFIIRVSHTQTNPYPYTTENTATEFPRKRRKLELSPIASYTSGRRQLETARGTATIAKIKGFSTMATSRSEPQHWRGDQYKPSSFTSGGRYAKRIVWTLVGVGLVALFIWLIWDKVRLRPNLAIDTVPSYNFYTLSDRRFAVNDFQALVGSAVFDDDSTIKANSDHAVNVADFFAIDWPHRLVQLIHAERAPDFAGQLSALYIGDTLLAAHFAMVTPHIWHSWFPAYDPRFAAYSPGHILLINMARAAAKRGVQHIDLGKGMSTYKKAVMTDAIPLCEGIVELPSLATSTRRARRAAEAWIRRSPLRAPARWVRRVIRPIERRRQFQ